MSDLLGSSIPDELYGEKSVRGEVVRLAGKRLQNAAPEEKPIIEAALQLLLDRFAAGERDKP